MSFTDNASTTHLKARKPYDPQNNGQVYAPGAMMWAANGSSSAVGLKALLTSPQAAPTNAGDASNQYSESLVGFAKLAACTVASAVEQTCGPAEDPGMGPTNSPGGSTGSSSCAGASSLERELSSGAESGDVRREVTDLTLFALVTNLVFSTGGGVADVEPEGDCLPSGSMSAGDGATGDGDAPAWGRRARMGSLELAPDDGLPSPAAAALGSAAATAELGATARGFDRCRVRSNLSYLIGEDDEAASELGGEDCEGDGGSDDTAGRPATTSASPAPCEGVYPLRGPQLPGLVSMPELSTAEDSTINGDGGNGGDDSSCGKGSGLGSSPSSSRLGSGSPKISGRVADAVVYFTEAAWSYSALAKNAFSLRANESNMCSLRPRQPSGRLVAPMWAAGVATPEPNTALTPPAAGGDMLQRRFEPLARASEQGSALLVPPPASAMPLHQPPPLPSAPATPCLGHPHLLLASPCIREVEGGLPSGGADTVQHPESLPAGLSPASDFLPEPNTVLQPSRGSAVLSVRRSLGRQLSPGTGPSMGPSVAPAAAPSYPLTRSAGFGVMTGVAMEAAAATEATEAAQLEVAAEAREEVEAAEEANPAAEAEAKTSTEAETQAAAEAEMQWAAEAEMQEAAEAEAAAAQAATAVVAEAVVEATADAALAEKAEAEMEGTQHAPKSEASGFTLPSLATLNPIHRVSAANSCRLRTSARTSTPARLSPVLAQPEPGRPAIVGGHNARQRRPGAVPAPSPAQHALLYHHQQHGPALTLKARAASQTPTAVAAAADASLHLSRRRQARQKACACDDVTGVPGYLRPTAAFAAKSSFLSQHQQYDIPAIRAHF